MKKILFAVALLAAFATQSFAEGLNFGLNISYQSEGMIGDADQAELFSDNTVSTGYAFGVNLRVPFNRVISLHTGLAFQVNMYDYTIELAGEEWNQENLFLNLQLPILARFNFTPGFFAEAGLDMQFNLLAQHYDESGEDSKLIDEWDDIENWNAFQMGPSFGLGYTMWFGLEFSGRFTWGLFDSFDKGLDDLSPIRFQIDITYWFGYSR